jgi:hypothetical protein
LRIVECPLLIQIKNRGSVEPDRASRRDESSPTPYWGTFCGALRINEAAN